MDNPSRHHLRLALQHLAELRFLVGLGEKKLHRQIDEVETGIKDLERISDQVLPSDHGRRTSNPESN